MKLKVKNLRFLTGKPVCMIHEKTAKQMSLHVANRVSITNSKGRKIISVVDTASGFLRPNEIALSEEILEILSLKEKDIVNVKITDRPDSIEYIKKKLKGETLAKQEITKIVYDIANNALTEVEVAFFISAVYANEMNIEETGYLIEAMVSSGNHMKLSGKVADKHCCGGIAGNRTTPIVVSICAEAGLIMPKTSSRAITSAAGTADTIETIAKVDFSVKEIKKIIKKTNACFVWGGALGLAPVDDKIIKIEKVANIDSTAQLLASILSKKISVGSKYILIDIPYGKSAKVSFEHAKILKEKFLKLGKKFKLDVMVVLTDGSEPIGNGIGPALEIVDVIKVLRNQDGPKDLEKKSIFLAGKILELTGKSKKGNGIKLATSILYSRKAFKKFEEIIHAQNGRIKELKTPDFFYDIISKKDNKIKHIDNMLINTLARHAGCPEDKFAGVYLYKKKNERVKKRDKTLTIYATTKEKLEYAKKFYFENEKKMIEFY
jgi:AMP phosphorylase